MNQKSPSIFVRIVNWINRFLRSFKNFVKSSALSLVIIVCILLLLTQMDQAFTMMVDLIENKNFKFSLFLSFFFVNALALVLSHYPIYTYYAADLNNSEDYTVWHVKYPINWRFFKLPVYVFTTNKESSYIQDDWANYLRYFIGILIHGVWIHFVIQSFLPNIIYEDFPVTLLQIVVYILLLVPFILYVRLRSKFSKLGRKTTKKGHPFTEEKQHRNKIAKKKLLRKLGSWYIINAFVCLLLLIITLTIGNFSPGGLILILLTSYALMFNYVFFRLMRTKLEDVKNVFSTKKGFGFFKWIIEKLLFLQKSENYILTYAFSFAVAAVLIVWCTIASVFEWNLLNGIPILLAFFYFYYFIIASLGKYFFVTKKMNLFGTKKYRIIFFGIITLIILFVISNFTGVDVTTHELDLVKNTKSEVPEKTFIDSLEAKEDNTLFFIASHGGGLKANVWTLNVLNTLQRETNGKLLNQTVALSGASGGSLGLALYTGLYREDGTNFNVIQQKIDTLSKQNYTSLDLTLTFGMDSFRKLWPFSQRIGVRDRPYYAMRKYQNEIENQKSNQLSEISFRDYWKEAFKRDGYFPSLIMNTAGTQGSRGILWSIKQDNFDAVFPFAINLADLAENKTLPYYQAVSTTNRFPVFSPAAKIKGYGHFIDAGAIDNSGLLGCLDVFNYLNFDKKILSDKQIAFIEIINGKDLYVDHLMKRFLKENNIEHISIDEKETDNIVADLQTGLNLDKIPGYLSDYLISLERNTEGEIRYFKIMMPHKVTLDDAEAYLNGEILNEEIEDKLYVFLKKENETILSLTEKPNKTFFEPWEYYEPTLSRHLSRSSINYFKAILKHPLLKQQFEEIETIINTKTVEENENPEVSL